MPPSARVAAAIHPLDRGWGKAPQTFSSEDGASSIRVVIRHILDGRDVLSASEQRARIDAAKNGEKHEGIRPFYGDQFGDRIQKPLNLQQ